MTKQISEIALSIRDNFDDSVINFDDSVINLEIKGIIKRAKTFTPQKQEISLRTFTPQKQEISLQT